MQKPSTTLWRHPFTLIWALLSVAVLLFALPHKAASVSHIESHPSILQKCHPGPWGDLEYFNTAIEFPDEYAETILKGLGPVRWFFGNINSNQLADCFDQAGLDTPTKNALLNPSHLENTPRGLWVFPENEQVLALRPEIREKLYTALGRFSENGYHQTPFIFRQDWLSERLKTSGLPETIQKKFRELLYPRGQLALFSDVPAMLSMMPGHEEKMRFLKMLHLKRTLMVQLVLTPQTDLKPLLKYWGSDRAWELKPLLEPLSQIDGGHELDIVHLLPSFPRSKLYTYPTLSRTNGLPNMNCHWSSFNFFNDPPDDKFRDFHFVKEALDKDYEVVSNKQFGDVIVLLNSSNIVEHSAVYIADDIVFTKNGGRETQPWVLMKMEDMLPFYEASEPIQVVVCRRKKV